MKRRHKWSAVLTAVLIGGSCAEKPPGPQPTTPQLTPSDYTEICSVVDRFNGAVQNRDTKMLRRVSPLVAFSLEEGMVDLGRIEQGLARVEHIIPGNGDALAFTGSPTAQKPTPWYYVQQHDGGDWVVQFCEDWDTSSPLELLNRCRAIARKAAAAQNIRKIEKALVSYSRDCGAPPTEEQTLGALIDNPGTETWNGPYLQLEALIDPWGTAFRYQLADSQPRITSPGPDRQHDTDDDVHVTTR